MRYDVQGRLGARFEVRASHVGERLDAKGIEPRLGPQLPVAIEVGSAGIAVLLRAGAVVLFKVDPIQQERFIADLGARIQGRAARQEIERVVVRSGDTDAIEPDGIVVRELSIERLQVIGEILGKSVVPSSTSPRRSPRSSRGRCRCARGRAACLGSNAIS